jgi:hypothetical protein
VDETGALLGCYAAEIGSYVSEQPNVPVFKEQIVPKRQYITTNLFCVRSQKSEDLIRLWQVVVVL